MPAPGLPRAARHAALGAHRPAARPVPAGLGAAPAAARDGERGRVRRRLVRAGRSGPGQVPARGPDLGRRVLRRRRPGDVGRARCWRRSAARPRAPTRGSPRSRRTRPAAGCSATTACWTAGRSPPPGSPRRCPPGRCSAWRPGWIRRCCGRWSGTGSSSAPAPADALADTVARAAGRGRERPVQLPADRRAGDRGHRGRRHAVVPRGRRMPWSWPRSRRRRARLDRGAGRLRRHRDAAAGQRDPAGRAEYRTTRHHTENGRIAIR